MAKTVSQIKQYIESQEWGNAFKENLKSSLDCSLAYFLKTIKKSHYELIIMEAFQWGKTPQKMGYWKSVHTEYLNWLRS